MKNPSDPTYSVYATSDSETPGCFIGEGMTLAHKSLLNALGSVPRNSTHAGFFIVRDLPGKDPARNPGRFSVAAGAIESLLHERGLAMTEENAVKAFYFLCVSRN